MLEYFEIREFSQCLKKEWDKFCFKSGDAWLWHTHDAILSKNRWSNHFNFSFSVIDISNKKNIVAVMPLFLVKKSKIIDYSSFDSLGGVAICDSLSKAKVDKLILFINNHLTLLMKKKKVYKCEFLLSTLSKSIIENNRIIANPLGPYISLDKSSFTWIQKLKNKSLKEIFDSFESKTKSILKKTKDLSFHELNNRNSKKIFNTYINLHHKMSSRKKINKKNKEYFEYIFFRFPISNKKIFYVKSGSNILSISVFGIYKGNAIYWTNVSDLNGLKKGSNYFCIWKALKYLKKINIQYVEFGEGFLKSEKTSKINLNHFKKSFGGEKYPLFRGDKINSFSKDVFINILRKINNYIKK